MAPTHIPLIGGLRGKLLDFSDSRPSSLQPTGQPWHMGSLPIPLQNSKVLPSLVPPSQVAVGLAPPSPSLEVGWPLLQKDSQLLGGALGIAHRQTGCC